MKIGEHAMSLEKFKGYYCYFIYQMFTWYFKETYTTLQTIKQANYPFSSHKITCFDQETLLESNYKAFLYSIYLASQWVIQRRMRVKTFHYEPHFLDIFDQKYTKKKQTNAKTTTWTIWFEPFRMMLLFNLLKLFFTPAWALIIVICCIKTDKTKILTRQSYMFLLQRKQCTNDWSIAYYKSTFNKD